MISKIFVLSSFLTIINAQSQAACLTECQPIEDALSDCTSSAQELDIQCFCVPANEQVLDTCVQCYGNSSVYAQPYQELQSYCTDLDSLNQCDSQCSSVFDALTCIDTSNNPVCYCTSAFTQGVQSCETCLQSSPDLQQQLQQLESFCESGGSDTTGLPFYTTGVAGGGGGGLPSLPSTRLVSTDGTSAVTRSIIPTGLTGDSSAATASTGSRTSSASGSSASTGASQSTAPSSGNIVLPSLAMFALILIPFTLL